MTFLGSSVFSPKVTVEDSCGKILYLTMASLLRAVGDRSEHKVNLITKVQDQCKNIAARITAKRAWLTL